MRLAKLTIISISPRGDLSIVTSIVSEYFGLNQMTPHPENVARFLITYAGYNVHNVIIISCHILRVFLSRNVNLSCGQGMHA